MKHFVAVQLLLLFVALLLVVVVATVLAGRAAPPSRDSGQPLPSTFTFDTPWYTVTATNKSNATIAAEYVRADPRAIDILLSDAGKAAAAEAMTYGLLPVWERSPASDYDDRIVWSPLMDKFSMPFFEHRIRNADSAATPTKGGGSSGAGITFHVGSNGFLTPSLDGYMCSNFFCNDFYFPNDRFGRTVAKEFDIVPSLALLVYDLDPRQSPSRHPISIFFTGNCARSTSGAVKVTTWQPEQCDSIVFDIDRVPMFRGADELNTSTPLLSAQAQLFRNGTVVMRYLHMCTITPEPWWHLPFQVEKTHPSCGLVNQNSAQIANVSEWCVDANPANGGAPLYNEFVFRPRDIGAERKASGQPPFPAGPACEMRANCSACTTSSACVWCEGAPPHASLGATLPTSGSGRCVDAEKMEGICGATPDLTVRGVDSQQPPVLQKRSASSLSSVLANPNMTVVSRCDALQINYARTQQPFRTAWFSAETGMNLPEWRDGGAWADASGPTIIRPTTGSAPEPGDAQSIGPRTLLPAWDKTVPDALAAKYGSTFMRANASVPASRPDLYTTRAGFITGNQLVPSAWWIHNIDLAGGNRDMVLSCGLGVDAVATEPILICNQVKENSSPPQTNGAMRISMFNLGGNVRPDNVTVVNVPGLSFDPSSSTASAPPHRYCIRRKCADAPSLLKLGMCAQPSHDRCDAFTMITWRGTVVPAVNGTFAFTLSAAIGEFGHIVTSVDLSSPLGNSVPAVLPKHAQHFTTSFPGGEYAAPMRRWAGAGLSTVMAPVTTCPKCPLGSSCDAVRGTCHCSPQFDDAKMCTVCRNGFIERYAEVQEAGLSAPTLAKRCVPCPPCQNGGTCNNVTGKCNCAPGFDGDLCDVACPPASGGGSNSAINLNETTAADIDRQRQNCVVLGDNAWICGRCFYPPLPTQPPKPYERPFWVYFIGWSILFIVLFGLLYFGCMRCLNWASTPSAEEQERRRRRRRRDSAGHGRRRRRMRGNGRNSDSGDSQDDDDDDDDGASDSDEYDSDGDNNGIEMSNAAVMADAAHGGGVDEQLRRMPPRVREQHILPMLERCRGTPQEAVWQRRLDAARRELQRVSNPLGIVVPASAAHTIAAGLARKPLTQQQQHQQQQHARGGGEDDAEFLPAPGRAPHQAPQSAAAPPQQLIPTATVIIPGGDKKNKTRRRIGGGGRSGLSSSSGEDDDAGPKKAPLQQASDDAPARPREQQSTSSYKLDDDDDDEADEHRAAGGRNPNGQAANATGGNTSRTVVRANPLAAGSSAETVVAGQLIGLDDL